MHIFFYIAAILTSCLTAFLYSKGIGDGWFWVYPWFDIPLHMLGGLMIALWAAGGALERKMSPQSGILYIFFIVFTVGILWEVFEYITELTVGPERYIIDTIADLVNDCIGGFISVMLYLYLHYRRMHHVI